MKSQIQLGGKIDTTGVHMVSYYYQKDHLLLKAALFIKEGVEIGEKCYFNIDPDQIPLLEKMLSSFGVDLEEVREKGQLEKNSVKDLLDIYINLGPEAVRVFLKDNLDEDLENGYTGIRFIGDTDYGILSIAPEIYLEWERDLDIILNDISITVLCMYNIEGLLEEDKKLTRLVNDTMGCHSYLFKGNKIVKTEEVRDINF